MMISLVSAKGAPGVTSSALALTAAAAMRGPALMVEADPGGGVLECWCGPLGEPGLVQVATRLGSGGDGEMLRDHAVALGSAIPVIVGPTTPAPMSVALRAVDPSLGAALAGLDGTVVVDAGRCTDGGGAATSLLKASSTVVAVCRPTLDSIEHTRALVAMLLGITAQPHVLVVGGTKPYAPGDIESALGQPVAGVLPWDQRGIHALLDPQRRRAWVGSPLSRAATDTIRRLAGHEVEELEGV